LEASQASLRAKVRLIAKFGPLVKDRARVARRAEASESAYKGNAKNAKSGALRGVSPCHIEDYTITVK
jgi:hypothetical protein